MKKDLPGQYITEPNELYILLSHILKHFEVNNSKQIISCLPKNKSKFTINSFRTSLAKLGVGTRYEKSSMRHNKNIKEFLPLLVISPYSPIVLVTSYKPDGFICIDGITGKEKKLNFLEIANATQILSFYKLDNQTLFDNNKNWHHKVMYRYRSSFISLFLTGFLLSILGLLIPVSIMIIYDSVIPTKSLQLLLSLAAGLGGFALAYLILDIFKINVLLYLNSRINIAINEIIVSKLISLPARMTENATIASQVMKIKNVGSLQDLFVKPWFTAIFELPGFILTFAAIGFIGGLLLIIPAVAALLHLILFILQKKYNSISARNNNIIFDRHINGTAQTLTHVKTLKYNSKTTSWIKKHHENNHRYCENSFKEYTKRLFLESLSSAIILINVVSIAILGSFLVISSKLSVGGLLACMVLGWISMMPFKNILQLLFYAAPLSNQINQIQKLLQLPSEYHPFHPYQPVDRPAGAISIKNLNYKYQGDNKAAIKNINLDIPANSLICVAGRNGSGKSTLLKLLTRLYESNYGIINVDNINIKQHNLVEYQQHIGYLSERLSIVPGTISQILLYDNPTATGAELVKACQRANLQSTIEKLPDGMNTELQSTDQTIVKTSNFLKKLSLARLYIKQAPILLLDEPTTYLTPGEITNLLKELYELKKECTILVVTHLPELFTKADNLIVLEEGEISFAGSYQDGIEKEYINIA